MITDKNIDNGKAFDWGRTSKDYAKYRDIYPSQFYQYILNQDIGLKGQRILDIGTGTGVIPRNLYQYGAQFTGIDISHNQIEQAKILAGNNSMDIEFFVSSAEDLSFSDETFDAVTACQCFTYFDPAVLPGKISRILKAEGKFAILYMAWLPYEDTIAGQSEDLILKYNPKWTGNGETRHNISIPREYKEYFTIDKEEIFDLHVPFSRETWHGRMKACRGIGASLPDEEIAQFEKEHRKLLNRTAPENFTILHYAAVTILKKKSVD